MLTIPCSFVQVYLNALNCILYVINAFRYLYAAVLKIFIYQSVVVEKRDKAGNETRHNQSDNRTGST